MSSNPSFFLSKNYGIVVGLIAVIGAVAGGAAFNTVQNLYDEQEDQNQLAADFYNFRNDVVEELDALDRQAEVNTGFIIQVRDNIRNETAELEREVSDEIFAIRAEMTSKHPKTPEEDPHNVETTGELTAKLLDTIIFTGQTITVWGKAEPGVPVFVVVVTLDRTIQGADVPREDGFYSVDIPTQFEDKPGSWTFRASQGELRTVPQPFEVKP